MTKHLNYPPDRGMLSLWISRCPKQTLARSWRQYALIYEPQRITVRWNSSSAADTSGASSSTATQQSRPLLPLSRPLGVRERPTIYEKAPEEKYKYFIDQEANKAENQHLCVFYLGYRLSDAHLVYRVKQMQKGYYKDILDTRFHGGKTWIAPKVLVKEDVRNCSRFPFGVPDSIAQKALYLPNLHGKALKENAMKHSTLMCFGKITILGLLGTRISEVRVFSNRNSPI